MKPTKSAFKSAGISISGIRLFSELFHIFIPDCLSICSQSAFQCVQVVLLRFGIYGFTLKKLFPRNKKTPEKSGVFPCGSKSFHHYVKMLYIFTSSASLSVIISKDSSFASKPLLDPRSGLTSRNSSKVVL